MSRSRKSGRGRAGGLFKQAATVAVIGAVIVGFFGIPSRPDVKDFPEMLQSKSDTVESWMENCVPLAIKGDFSKCSLGANVGGSTAPAPISSKDVANAEQALASLVQAGPASISYDRDEWNHWVTSGSNSCWNVREAVLLDEAVKGSAELQDKAGNVVTSESKACSITKGEWDDPYTGSTVTDPKKLDIDHMIPLAYAAKHGGQAWGSEKKQKYANDTSYSNHLVAVSASANRAKSDKGPSEWQPANKDFHCEYAVSWITVSENYGLSVAKADATALKKMLTTC